jgi:predicted outer membrane protein
MSARSLLRPITLAVLLAGLTAVASAARSADGYGAQHSAWTSGGGHYDGLNLSISSQRNVLNKKAAKKAKKKKKNPKKNVVAISEPPMSALLGTGLVLLGVLGWVVRRKA